MSESKKKTKEKKEKPIYSVGQNCRYVIAQLWRSNKVCFFLLVLEILCTLGASVAEMYLPKVIVQNVEQNVALPVLLLSAGALAGAVILCQTVKAACAENNGVNYTGQRVGLVGKLIKKLMATDFPNLGQEEFRNLMGKVMDSAGNNNSSTEQIYNSIKRFCINLLGFVIYLILLTSVNPLILLLVFLSTLLSFFVRQKSDLYRYGAEKDTEKYVNQLWFSKDVSGLGYMKDLQLFGMKGWLEDVFSSVRKMYYGIRHKISMRDFLADAVDCLSAFVREGAAYAYLIFLVLQKGLPVDEFVLLFAAIGGFSTWIVGIMQEYSQLRKYSQEYCRVRAYLEYPDVFNHDGTKVEKADGYEITLKDVSFRYEGAEDYTLRHINLTIHAGENLAVVGLNGAGKTTLVQLICGLYDPTEGQILLNGRDIKEYDRSEYYKLFCAVFQDFSILPATVGENVSQQVKEEIDKKRLYDCLRLADLEEKIKSLPEAENTMMVKEVYPDAAQLSGGETQRLMLARALYKDAPVLILDEPTAALDPIAESRLYEKYSELSKRRVTIYISHRLASTRFCDRIIVIADKGISECGTHEELLAAGKGYAELFEIQSQYYQEKVGEEA